MLIHNIACGELESKTTGHKRDTLNACVKGLSWIQEIQEIQEIGLTRVDAHVASQLKAWK